MAECYVRNESCLIILVPPCNFSDSSIHSYDLQRSQKYRFFSTLPLPTTKFNVREEWGILSEHFSLKSIKQKVCWKLWLREKNPFSKEETFCSQPCALNISKTKINPKDGLSLYPRGNQEKHFSGN